MLSQRSPQKRKRLLDQAGLSEPALAAPALPDAPRAPGIALPLPPHWALETTEKGEELSAGHDLGTIHFDRLDRLVLGAGHGPWLLSLRNFRPGARGLSCGPKGPEPSIRHLRLSDGRSLSLPCLPPRLGNSTCGHHLCLLGSPSQLPSSSWTRQPDLPPGDPWTRSSAWHLCPLLMARMGQCSESLSPAVSQACVLPSRLSGPAAAVAVALAAACWGSSGGRVGAGRGWV